MAIYMIVANQTASSDELLLGLRDKLKADPAAEFFLLVPATPVDHLLLKEEGDPRQIAARRAGKALIRLTDAGLPIVGATIGDSSPQEAIDAEMRHRPGVYSGIVLSTFPEAVSHWLDADLPYRLQRRFGIPVTHVVAEAGVRA